MKRRFLFAFICNLTLLNLGGQDIGTPDQETINRLYPGKTLENKKKGVKLLKFGVFAKCLQMKKASEV